MSPIVALIWFHALLPWLGLAGLFVKRWSKLRQLLVMLWVARIAFVTGLLDVGAWFAAKEATNVLMALWYLVCAGGVWWLGQVILPGVRAQHQAQQEAKAFGRGPAW